MNTCTQLALIYFLATTNHAERYSRHNIIDRQPGHWQIPKQIIQISPHTPINGNCRQVKYQVPSPSIKDFTLIKTSGQLMFYSNLIFLPENSIHSLRVRLLYRCNKETGKHGVHGVLLTQLGMGRKMTHIYRFIVPFSYLCRCTIHIAGFKTKHVPPVILDKGDINIKFKHMYMVRYS